MLSEALVYPVRGEDREETLLVGAILVVTLGLLARLGVLAVLSLVPAVLLAGYAQSVFRATVESSGASAASADAPPRFGNVRTLAADGLRAVVVAVGYLSVPATVLVLTVGGASAGGRPESFGTTLFVFGAGTVVLFLSLGFAYLLPAALAGVARTRTLGAALDRGRLVRSARSGGYFVALVAAVVTSVVFAVALGSLAAFGRPGEVAALAGGFYALVVVARLVGRGVA
ncbi:DUF4013 domain-containing protein [Halorussus gelatinilyticus]|uniref:DUF4013 domain-containing protein n=1 Tax=Halorussus gelatinilyticus TaxID=2937524 RepID=A0A8U0IHU2_9EURY|nr:DUF4013 domain-containing protein [Halorussus gelatinilyticus]UPW00657.1 DUF4013 domain-containing protein [Halorussus gelatinilyticus]